MKNKKKDSNIYCINLKKIILVLIILINFYTINFNSVNANLNEKIELVSNEISDFFINIDKGEIIIILGSKISIEEKMLFNLIKTNIIDLQGIEIISDKDYKNYNLKNNLNDNLLNKNSLKNIVLVGSEKTNLITKELMNNLTIQKEKSYSPIYVIFGEIRNYNNDNSDSNNIEKDNNKNKINEKNKKVLILHSEKEIKNINNNILKKSILKNFIDEKYIPIVASFISILLLYLWNIIFKTGIEFGSDFISSKILQKITSKKKSKKKAHNIKFLKFIEKSEIIAFILYTIIFSIVISYSWSNNFKSFLELIIISIAVIGILTFVREFSRQYYCFKEKINSELVFWPFGSILTLLSTILGNTFSLASYTLVDEEHEKLFGKVSFFISIYTYLIALIFYVLNIIKPNLIFQIVFVYCLLVLFIDLFPMKPMAGKDIINWKFIPWLIIYIIVFISYIYINFSAYVFYI